MAESYDYESVLEAVTKHGVDQWNLIGGRLGMTIAEMTAATHDKPSSAGKLWTIISNKRNDLGDRELIKQLLEACANIPQPILGMVKQHMATGKHSSAMQATVDTTVDDNEVDTHTLPSKQMLLSRRTHPPFPPQIGPFGTVIGRDRELSSIEENYQTRRTQDDDSPIIQIIGAGGGMGKTDTAFQYARKNKKQYADGIFFFFSESKSTFTQSVRENLVAIGLRPFSSPSENFVVLQAYVQRHPRCLFLYDNVHDLSILDDYIPAIPLHILITTRRHSFHSLRLQPAHVLRLGPMHPDMAVQLLLKLCDHPLSPEELQQQCPSEYEHALKVVGPDMLNGLPLGIVHAAAMIREQFSYMTDRLKELSATLEKNKGQLSLKPTSVKEWLRKYHLSGIQLKLESELKINSLVWILFAH
jgi:hypothetical protein